MNTTLLSDYKSILGLVSLGGPSVVRSVGRSVGL